jgi:hypothetical protein
MTTVHTPPGPDTTDVVAVHSVFRQALTAAPALIQGASVGDTGRVALVGSYYDNVLRFLAVHHQAEDELIWPKLRERCPADADLVEAMISNHEDMQAAADAAAAYLVTWISSPDAETGSRLTNALAQLGTVLLPHLDEEEARIGPLCAEHMTVEEWGQLPGHAMAHYDGDKIWLIQGLIRENMTESQRATMLEKMPAPGREMWTTAGRRAFDAFVAELRRSLER